MHRRRFLSGTGIFALAPPESTYGPFKGAMRALEIDIQKEPNALRSHGQSVSPRFNSVIAALSWDPSSHRIAISPIREKRVFIWDVYSDTVSTSEARDGVVTPIVAFSSSGKFLLTEAFDHNLSKKLCFSLLDGYTGVFCESVVGPDTSSPVNWVQAASAGMGSSLMAVRSGDLAGPTFVALYDEHNWQFRHWLYPRGQAAEPPDASDYFRYHFIFHGSMHFAREGAYVALGGSVLQAFRGGSGPNDGALAVIVLPIDSDSPLKCVLLTGRHPGLTMQGTSICRDGKTVVVGLQDSNGYQFLNLVDTVSSTLLEPSCSLKTRGLNALSCSPTADVVATVSMDQRLRFWTLPSLALLSEEVLDGWSGAISFSPDGTKLAIGVADKVIIRRRT